MIIIAVIVVITDRIEDSIIIRSSDYFLRNTFLPTRSRRKKNDRERMLRLQVGLIALTLHACLHVYQACAVLHFPRSFLIHSYFVSRPTCLQYSSFVIPFPMILLASISTGLHVLQCVTRHIIWSYMPRRLMYLCSCNISWYSVTSRNLWSTSLSS